MTRITPNKTLVFLITGIVTFACLSIVVDPVVLRSLFNNISLGVSVMVAVTWGHAAFLVLRRQVNSADWLLVVSIAVLFAALSYRTVFAMIAVWMERPPWLIDSALAAFIPYSFTVAGLGFLVAPGMVSTGATKAAWWHLGIAGMISGLVAGILIGRTLPPF